MKKYLLGIATGLLLTLGTITNINAIRTMEGEKFFRNGCKALMYDQPGIAITEYEKAIEKGIEKPELYNFLGEAYQQQKNIEKAAYWFFMALDVSPNNPSAYANLTELAIQFDNPNESLKFALKLQETNKDPHNNLEFLLGHAYRLNHNLKKNITSFSKNT